MCNVTRNMRVPFTWSRVVDFPPSSWNMARCFVSRAVRVVESSGDDGGCCNVRIKVFDDGDRR